MILKRKAFGAVAMAALFISACSQQPKQDAFVGFVDKAGKWSMTKEEKAKYGKLTQNEARSLFISDKFKAESAKLQTVEEKKMLAVALYANFKMLQARAIPAYCQGMNVDISGYTDEFSRINRAEEVALAELLQARGLNFEDIYGTYAKRLRTTAKYELMSAGSSYSACTTVRDKPRDLAVATKFSKFNPGITSKMR